MKKTNVYAEIIKVDKQEDGSLLVTGRASGPDLDSDKQICDSGWLKTAMPDWFKFANIREQHSAIAAGVGTSLEQQGDGGWNVTAHVVDAGSVKKIDAKVLKGFSIGISGAKVIKDATAPGGRIVGGEIVEVSLVDRPANPSCLLSLAKSVNGVLTKDETMSVAGSGLEPTADGGEGTEVDLIAVARDALTQWLASEAAEVAAGTGGTFVVRLVLNVLEDLEWAAEADAYDDAAAALEAVKTVLSTPPQEADVLTLSSLATLTKAAGATDAAADVKAEFDDVRKSLGIVPAEDIATQITEAVTKATGPLEETIKGLSDTLAKVSTTVLTAGPQRVATPADANKAAAHDHAMSEVSRLNKLADDVTDPELASGYRELARRAAATLTV